MQVHAQFGPKIIEMDLPSEGALLGAIWEPNGRPRKPESLLKSILKSVKYQVHSREILEHGDKKESILRFT